MVNAGFRVFKLEFTNKKTEGKRGVGFFQSLYSYYTFLYFQRLHSSSHKPPSSSSGGMHSAGGGRRPVKIWNGARTVRKALVVSTYEEFHRKGREKLGLGKVEPVRVVLESDGTQVGKHFYL